VVVDTNGDLTPDTRLPGTSNFWSGRSADDFTSGLIGPCCETCHAAEGHWHCYYPSNCYPVICE
jgi:hypothetical protein